MKRAAGSGKISSSFSSSKSGGLTSSNALKMASSNSQVCSNVFMNNITHENADFFKTNCSCSCFNFLFFVVDGG